MFFILKMKQGSRWQTHNQVHGVRAGVNFSAPALDVTHVSTGSGKENEKSVSELDCPIQVKDLTCD